PEGGEVAGVDADGVGAERDRPRELLRVVGLDERVEAELAGPPLELRRPRVVEVAEQEEDGVGSRLRERADVLLGAEEALAEQRQARRRARRPEIVDRPAEP